MIDRLIISQGVEIQFENNPFQSEPCNLINMKNQIHMIILFYFRHKSIWGPCFDQKLSTRESMITTSRHFTYVDCLFRQKSSKSSCLVSADLTSFTRGLIAWNIAQYVLHVHPTQDMFTLCNHDNSWAVEAWFLVCIRLCDDWALISSVYKWLK